jgi:hypothetical protein
MSKPWNPGGSTEFDDSGGGFRGDLDPEKLVWLQIRTCNNLHSQGDEILFGNAVMSLFAIIPSSIREDIEDHEEDYHTYDNIWKSVLTEGDHGSADPDNPDISNIKGTLRYNPHFRGRHYEKVITKTVDEDGKEVEEIKINEVYEIGGPHQTSPIYIESEQWDYYALFKLITRKLEERGLTWHVQRIEKITGNEWDPSKDTEEDNDDDPDV